MARQADARQTGGQGRHYPEPALSLQYKSRQDLACFLLSLLPEIAPPKGNKDKE